MKKCAIWCVAVAVCSLAQAAGTPPQGMAQPVAVTQVQGGSDAGTATDRMVAATKKAMTLYESPEGFVRKVKVSWIEQFQVAGVQPNGSNGLWLKSGASPVNQEFRRSWVGLTTNLAGDTTFRTWLRVGGLPERETFAAGHTKRNFSYTSLFEIWLKKDNAAGVKGLSVQVGKIKSLFTTDYSTLSSVIPCIERSVISNQFAQDSNWGVDVTYAPSKADKVYVQLMANDRASSSKNLGHADVYRDGRGVKGEFGWEDRCFVILGASHKFAETEGSYQMLSAQYLHDFDNAYHGKHTPGANYYGLGFLDAVSLGYEWKQNRFTLLTNLVSAFEQQTGKGSNNIGIQIQPMYALSPHVDLIFRYTGMTGHGACKLSADRYICTQTVTPAWVDSINTFYLGADFYLSAKDKNAMKWMVGAEYTTARSGGSDCYNGWTLSSAIRWSL